MKRSVRQSRSKAEDPFADAERAAFRARVDALVAEAGNFNALAKAAKIPQSSARRYHETGEPPRAIIYALARARGVRPEWLFSGQEPMRGDGEQSLSPLEVVWVPIHVASLAAEEAQPQARLGVPAQWLQAKSQHLCLVAVEGDGMDPSLRAGSYVLVDRADRTVRDGIFVLGVNGVIQPKRLCLRGNKMVEVVSDNPAYPAWSARIAEINPLGKVVWIASKVG